jgi:hypothetical protein
MKVVVVSVSVFFWCPVSVGCAFCYPLVYDYRRAPECVSCFLIPNVNHHHHRLAIPRERVLFFSTGNKLRKLWRYLHSTDIAPYKGIMSHGGHQSNAMLAIAQLANDVELPFSYFTAELPAKLADQPEGNLLAAVCSLCLVVDVYPLQKCTHTHTHTHTYIYIPTHPHLLVHTPTRTCIHTHTHTHTYTKERETTRSIGALLLCDSLSLSLDSTRNGSGGSGERSVQGKVRFISQSIL